MTEKLMGCGVILLFGLAFYVISSGLAVAGLGKYEIAGIFAVVAALLFYLDNRRKNSGE